MLRAVGCRHPELVSGSISPQPNSLNFETMKVFEGKQEIIDRLCSENKVRSLFVFGSAVRDELTDDSDIDLLVDIDSSDPYEYTDHYYNLLEQLQQLLQRPIDLLESRALKNPFLKKEIDRTKVAVYG